MALVTPGIDVRTLLADPAAFYSNGTPRLRDGALAPLLLGVLSLGLFPLFLALLRSPEVPEDTILDAFAPVRYATANFEVSIPGAYGVFLLTLFIAPLFYCVAYTLFYYALSWPVADERGLAETAAALGVAFLPLLLANVVVIAVLLGTYPRSPETVWAFGFSPPAQLYASLPDSSVLSTLGPL